MNIMHAMRTFFAYLEDKTEKRRFQRKSASRKYLILLVGVIPLYFTGRLPVPKLGNLKHFYNP